VATATLFQMHCSESQLKALFSVGGCLHDVGAKDGFGEEHPKDIIKKE